jgi:hypothetical protein
MSIEGHSRWADAWWTRLPLAIGAMCMITPDMRLTAVGSVIVALTLGMGFVHRRVPA